MSQQPILDVQGLSVSFGDNPVLREIDFELYPGDAAMIVGANGAGKSTLTKVFAGLIALDHGRATVFGEESRCLEPATRRKIGLMTHLSFLYPNLTARENLEFYAGLYGVADAQAVSAELLERVGLTAFAGERVRTFSRGMEQRLAAARALLASPELLLLDEPFAALDADGAGRVAGLICEAIARGCAVVITAHQTMMLDAVAFAGVTWRLFQIVRGRLSPLVREGFADGLRAVRAG